MLCPLIVYKRLKGIFLVTLCFLLNLDSIWIILAGSPGIAAVVMFVIKIYSMLKQRKRKIVDSTLRYWKVGLITLPISVLFIVSYTLWQDEKFLFLFGIIFLFGFALSITSGMLYKIIPFLVWFHRFSSLAGQEGVPLMKDIISKRSADWQWKIFMIMFLLLAGGIVFHVDILIRLAGGVFIISSGLLFANFYKAIYKIEFKAS